jgi:hypothetical protein
MWLFSFKSLQVDPTIPESQIPITNDKEGTETSLMDIVPEANLSPAERAELIEEIQNNLSILKSKELPEEYIDESLTPEQKQETINQLITKYQDMLEALLNQVSDDTPDALPDALPDKTPVEATQIMDAIDVLLDNPAQFKNNPKLQGLSEEEFNASIEKSLAEARKILKEKYPDYSNYRK